MTSRCACRRHSRPDCKHPDTAARPRVDRDPELGLVFKSTPPQPFKHLITRNLEKAARERLPFHTEMSINCPLPFRATGFTPLAPNSRLILRPIVAAKNTSMVLVQAGGKTVGWSAPPQAHRSHPHVALAQKLIAENKRTKETSLDLGNCGLTEIPSGVGELTWLTSLSFASNWSEWNGTGWDRKTCRKTR